MTVKIWFIYRIFSLAIPEKKKAKKFLMPISPTKTLGKNV